MMQRVARLALLGLLAATSHVSAQADPYADARQQFMTAWSVLSAAPASAPGSKPESTPATTAPDSEALRTYPLYPYLRAARLQKQLADLPSVATDPGATDTPALLPLDASVEAFLAPLGNQPVTRNLRHDWMTSLASRRAWPKFLDVYSTERDGGDAALRCQAIAGRLALARTDGIVAEITEAVSGGKALPCECDAALEWLRLNHPYYNDIQEGRARSALSAGNSGLARYLARSLPSERAAPLLQWADLIDQPGKSIDALIAEPARPFESAALLDGWARFARKDGEAAAERLPALVEARKLDERGSSPYALAVALAKSWSRTPGALEYFDRVNPADFDERAHEWHVRAALWNGDWDRARKAIEAMPEALRNQNRWRYWAARSAEQLGDKTAAQRGYAAVVPTDNWYAVLAAARLGQPFAPHPQPLALSEAGVVSLGTEPGFVRAHELLLCGLDTEAGAEWRDALDGLPKERQALAVGLASRWGWHLQAIATAARQGLFNDYDVLYPRPFDVEVRGAAARTGLPEYLIYAIIRQESLYRADAGSSAGALGLMQLLPETARRTAKRAGLPSPTRSSLLIPSVNVPLGAATLKDLIDHAAGQTSLAVAGYNAGPGAARRWLPPAPMETDRWVENIPFNETRAYVQKVAWHSLVFAWLGERKARDVSNWLATIDPPTVD
jgi:soluble lytic murein transglycosylase